MAYERVQKTFGQSSSKKKHTPIVPPLNEELTQAGSQLSPKLKPSRIPSSEERDAIKRKIFDSISRSGENQAMREGLFSETVPAQKAPASSSVAGTPIQAKLTIGAPGDKYEQEADRVAAQVVNLLNAPVAQQESQKLQREVLSVEEEELQMKPMVQLQPGAGGMTATPEVETSIQQARSGGQPLADNIRQPMERAFGADFSGVKVHTDAQADQLNQSIQAKAFTTGQDVFFRSGEYNPGSRGGQELLAHELTHVVQQSAGGGKERVNRTEGENTSLPPFAYVIQGKNHPDNKLCLYFAYYHYMNGKVNKDEFISTAIQPYIHIGMSEEDALNMFYDGNDPGVYQQFGLNEVGSQALAGERLIVADVKKGHFYALRKYNDTWWNYDSYFQNKPSLIGTQEQAMKYLDDLQQPVWA